jgi:HipA-like protein
MKFLEVKYNGRIVGSLFQDKSGRMLFQYDGQWLTEGFAISISLPLQNEVFAEEKCRPFFEGLLPEGIIRDEIARNLGVSSKSDFALLREIGGDCAGAISIGDSKEVPSDGYKELLKGEVFRRHWHEFAKENAVNPKFMDKEIEYVSNFVSEYCEPVAQQLFGTNRCLAIANIFELIQRKLKLLERK